MIGEPNRDSKLFSVAALVKKKETNKTKQKKAGFIFDLCDAGYVGFTRRHLHQRVDEHTRGRTGLNSPIVSLHYLLIYYLDYF